MDQITSVANSIECKNLSQRITVPQTGDELQRMAQTWNDVLERLDIAVSASGSSRLTLPTNCARRSRLIRATAELALRETRREGYRASLRQIEHEAEHMTTLTESLLTLARGRRRARHDDARHGPQPTDRFRWCNRTPRSPSRRAMTLRAVTAEEPANARGRRIR